MISRRAFLATLGTAVLAPGTASGQHRAGLPRIVLLTTPTAMSATNRARFATGPSTARRKEGLKWGRHTCAPREGIGGLTVRSPLTRMLPDGAPLHFESSGRSDGHVGQPGNL